MNNMNEHKKGVKAKIYNKKPVPLVGPEALKKKEQQKKTMPKKPSIEETAKLSTREKFKRSLKRAGYDPDAGAKRIEDLLAKQKAEREKFEKENPDVYSTKEKDMKENKKNPYNNVTEEEMGKIVDYKAGQTATLASGPGMTTIIDLKKNPTSLTKDPSTGKLKLMGPQATGTPAATSTQASTIKAGDAVEISKEDDVSRMKNLAGIQEAPQAATTAAPAPQQPAQAQTTQGAQPAPAQAKPGIKVPPIPQLPAQDGDQGDGSVVKTNPDGTKSYAGAFGTFTYDKAGKAIKYNAPGVGGMSGAVDLTTGGQTTSYNAGDVSATGTQNAAGKVTGTSATYSPATMSQPVTKTEDINFQKYMSDILRLAGR